LYKLIKYLVLNLCVILHYLRYLQGIKQFSKYI